MGKYQEYLKLIPKFFKNPDKILQGWMNAARFENDTLTEEEMIEVIRRRAICEECPFSSFLVNEHSDYKNLYGQEYKTKRADNHCTHCACNLTYKTACMDCNCGAEFYNQENPDKTPLELKWTKLKTNNNDDGK